MNKETDSIKDYLSQTDNKNYNPDKIVLSERDKKKRIQLKQQQAKRRTKSKPFQFSTLKHLFDLEAGIDILNETESLYRRNKIIKRIVFLTNITFGLFLLTRSFSLIIITGLVFVFTFGINRLLESLIYNDPSDELNQKIAMYLVSGNTLIVAISTFINLHIDALNAFNTNLPDAATYAAIANVSYGLVFFSLILTAFYQNKQLMLYASYATMFVYTVLHLVVIYPVYQTVTDFVSFTDYLVTNEARDIGIRTIILLMFVLAINFNVRISEKLNEERKYEISNRRGLEKDFIQIIKDLFSSIEIFQANNLYLDQFSTYRSVQMIRKLAGLIGKRIQELEAITTFAKIHIDQKDVLTLLDYESIQTLNPRDYAEIERRTTVGRRILKRIRIHQYAEDLIRNFTKRAFEKELGEPPVAMNLETQLVLLFDLYDALRMDRLYKDAFTHREAVRILRDQFSDMFEFQLLDRFIRFEDEFRELYDTFVL
jgi:response regulator RpfG family c-di-GMP phosphodiesterase